MHDHRFGKGERHAHKTSETLPQGGIPPLDMGGFSRLFSHSGMLFLWDHRLRRCPEVCEAMAKYDRNREWPPTTVDTSFYSDPQPHRPPLGAFDDTEQSKPRKYGPF